LLVDGEHGAMIFGEHTRPVDEYFIGGKVGRVDAVG
jgi:hypothetical protein